MKITWKFFVWLAMLPLSFFPALFVNTVFGYLPVFAVLFLGLSSFLYLKSLRKKIFFEQGRGEPFCVRGEGLDFMVSVKNVGWLPVVGMEAIFFVSGANREETSLQLTLKAKEVRDFHFFVDFGHIGIYQTGMKTILLYDLLGIFRVAVDGGGRQDIEVLPRVYPLDKLAISEHAFSESPYAQIQSSITGADYTEVREYAFGDTIKSIHWKLSAHLSSMVTKKMEIFSNTGISIVPDFRIPEYELEKRLSVLDTLAETAVSVGSYAQEQGIEYDLMYLRSQGEKVRLVPPSFYHLFGVVSEWSLVDEKSAMADVEQILRQDCASIYGHSNVAVCTASLSEGLLESICALKHLGKTPLVFYVLPVDIYEKEGTDFLKPLRRLETERIPYYVIRVSDELKDVDGDKK